MIRTVNKLLLCIASCVTLSTAVAVVDTLSPNFVYVVKVERPCKVRPGSTFQVVYTMQNDSDRPIIRTSNGSFLFPMVLTLEDLTGAVLVNFEADTGTQFNDDTQSMDFGRWESQDGLAKGEIKKLILTLQVTNPTQVSFLVLASQDSGTYTCFRQITIPVDIDTTCPASDTTTITAQVVSSDRIASITFPNMAFFNQPFDITYNFQTSGAIEFWANIFPLLKDSEGREIFEVMSVETIPASTVTEDNTLFATGRGQGLWIIENPDSDANTFLLKITLRPTFRAPNLLAYVTKVNTNNPGCTIGPVQVQITDQEECEELSDPVALALASLIPPPSVGG